MIVILVVLLVALLAFIGYWVATQKNREAGTSSLSGSSAKAMPTAGSRKPVIDDDEDEGTRVRIAGPRLIRTMGGLNVGDEMPIGMGLTIGRGQQCSITLHDQEMSSLHAEFKVKHGEAQVTDLGSTNGTFVNGVQIAPNVMTPLKNNDEIRLGMTHLVYKDPD